MANLKKEVTSKQSTPNFHKKEYSLPPYTQTYVRNDYFLENLVCFVILLLLFSFSYFEIRPFLLLLTSFSIPNPIFLIQILPEKCPNTEFFWSIFFLHSDWIRRDAEYLSVFSPSAGKYGPEKTPYLDNFHAVKCLPILKVILNLDKFMKILFHTTKYLVLWCCFYLRKMFYSEWSQTIKSLYLQQKT